MYCRCPCRTNPQQRRDSSPRPASPSDCGAVRECFRHQLRRSLLLPGAQRSIRHGHTAVPRPPLAPLFYGSTCFIHSISLEILFYYHYPPSPPFKQSGRRDGGTEGGRSEWAAVRGDRPVPLAGGVVPRLAARDPQRAHGEGTRKDVLALHTLAGLQLPAPQNLPRRYGCEWEALRMGTGAA